MVVHIQQSSSHIEGIRAHSLIERVNSLHNGYLCRYRRVIDLYARSVILLS